jgi:lipoprotein-anchoring transpeptidase ErfK/SrfK
VAVVAAIGAGGVALATRYTGPSKAEVAAKKAAAARAAAQAAQAALLQAQTTLAAAVSISPATGSTGVVPAATVSVSTTAGMITSVSVTGGAAGDVAGSLNTTSTGWQSSAPLHTDTTYQVVALVTGSDGVTATKTATFSTVVPTALVTATVFPTTGLSVGVGQPIVLTFNHDISSVANQRAVVSHLTVAMSQPVPGGWYWFSPHELHFRPATYWPAHETVSVSGDLDGWDAGNGRWGSGKITDTFTIGDARISYANLAADQMRVTLNGATIAVYPISGGRDQYPTMNGDHIVMDRQSVVHMVSSTVGIPVNSPNGYDEYVYEDVHISDSGEYVHSAPWSVASQGVTNVSHGCINLSPDNATTYFNFSRVGDVVEVTGSSRPAVSGDHGVMDWSTPWSSWIPGTVVAS